MKLILKKIKCEHNRFDITDVTIESEDIVALNDALSVCEDFLIAAGFIIKRESLRCDSEDE